MNYLKQMKQEERRRGYPVSISKSSEGGPCLCDIKSAAKSMGIKVESYPSCYVGQVIVALRKGTKRQFKKLLGQFGCDYL